MSEGALIEARIKDGRTLLERTIGGALTAAAFTAGSVAAVLAGYKGSAEEVREPEPEPPSELVSFLRRQRREFFDTTGERQPPESHRRGRRTELAASGQVQRVIEAQH